MRRWKCLFLGNALFNDSLFFDSETILLKGMFISHSKNVERQCKEKADESALTKLALFERWMSFVEKLCKYIKYFTINQIIE